MRNTIKTSGFTLIELMITLVLTTIIIGSIYVIYTSSVTSYRVENQLLDMQERVRFGLEHLKRDLRLAGFLVSPNTTIDSDVCPKPDYELRAIRVNSNVGALHWTEANPFVSSSGVTLFGDFFSGRSYRIYTVQGSDVYFQNWGNLPTTAIGFSQIFTANRYLRIVSQHNFEMLIPIQSVDFDQLKVTLTQTVPTASQNSPCGIAGFGEGLEANVAGFIRYRILADTRPNAPFGKLDLVREEVQIDGETPVAGTQLVVADYAVELQFYDFGFDMAPSGSVPSIVVHDTVDDVVDAGGIGLLGGTLIARPQDLRFMTVKLTVRTEEEDPTYVSTPRTAFYQPLDGYELIDMEGACRTLTMATRVHLSSLAVRGLKAPVAP